MRPGQSISYICSQKQEAQELSYLGCSTIEKEYKILSDDKSQKCDESYNFDKRCKNSEYQTDRQQHLKEWNQ